MEVIPSEQGGPYAFKTLLGWCIVGTIGETTFDTTVACNRISVQDKVSKNVASHYFAMETEVQDIRIEQDNGSNFVVAQKELEKAYSQMDHQKIQFFLHNIGADYINWHRNPPASSHMVGVWERQNQST